MTIEQTLDATKLTESCREIFGAESKWITANGELAERHAVVGEVPGRGVSWALELVQDRATKEHVPAAYMG